MFRITRGQLAELYCKGYSADQMMTHTHHVLDGFGIPPGSNTRSRLCVALWNISHRPGVPSICDMLAEKEQFDVEGKFDVC
jgi:hypothetical protein